jgi:hypothetical protein
MRRIRFIPVKDGDAIDLGDTGVPTTSYYATKPKHLILGFKPGPGPKAAGWLVVLVDEDAKPRTRRPRKLRVAS